jgi:hypothetical protein
MGLYVLLESVDPPFLSRTFTHTHGNVYSPPWIYSPPWNTDVTERLDCIGGHETNSLADLKALAAAARTPSAADLSRVLDVDRFLSFMALEVMLCHWDGYTSNIKNYLLYHDVDAQRMVFVPHDMDQMLQDPVRPIVPRAKGIVARAVLADPELRKRYIERFGQLYAQVFVASALTRRVDEAVKRLAPGIEAYDPGLGQVFAQNAEDLKRRIVNRARYLKAHLPGLTPSSPRL